MDQPGIEVRPLRQMNGHASFNEVFITGACVSASDVIGEVGGGWAIALTTLAHERRSFVVFGWRSTVGGTGRAATEAEIEAERHYSSYVWYPQRAGRADLLVDNAQARGVAGDSVVRQAVARALGRQRINGFLGERARSAPANGRPPGPEGSVAKLAASALAREAARAHSRIAGAQAMLAGADGTMEGVVAEVLVSTPAISIAGGTDEIQRNIIGERVLGLPKEPATGRDLPFRDVPRNVR